MNELLKCICSGSHFAKKEMTFMLDNMRALQYAEDCKVVSLLL